jgi:hypothetical protein
VELDCHNDFVLCALYRIFNLLKFIIEVHQKIFLWAEILYFVFGTSYMANSAEQREITANTEFLTITVCGCNCPNLGLSGRSQFHHQRSGIRATTASRNDERTPFIPITQMVLI